MGVSVAGVDLLISGVDCKMDRWAQRFLNFRDMRIVTDWPNAVVSSNQHSIPLVNYSRPTTPRPSVWYYPTGAGRWGFGLFYCDTDRLNQIASSIGWTSGVSKATTLFLNDSPARNSRTFAVYLLPPRRLGHAMWILPVVDVRYFWQFITPGGITFDDRRSWTDVISQLATVLSVNIAFDAPSTNYPQPNPFWLTQNGWMPVGQLLDALLYSIGFRLIDDSLGDWYAASVVTSVQRHLSNLAKSEPMVVVPPFATFPLFGTLSPANIVVAFRSYNNGVIEKDWALSRFNIIEPAGAFPIPISTAGYNLTVRSMALADFTGGVTVPLNLTTLTALADQIATDIYTYLSYPIDVPVVGVSTSLTTGLYDYMEFCVGETPSGEPGGERTFETRIHGLPANTFCGDLVHWDNSTWEYGTIISGVLNTALAANGTAKMMVASNTKTAYSDGILPPLPVDTAVTLTVTDIHNSGFASGKMITAAQMDSVQARQTNGSPGTWIVLAGQC